MTSSGIIPAPARENRLFLFIAFSLSYLTLPYLIFFFGWFSIVWSVLLTLVCLLALIKALRHLHQQIQQQPVHWQPSGRQLLFLILLCGTLVAISGAGGYGYQDDDWRKHNVILQDLVENAWPVDYEFYGRPVVLVYYIAYYLPAALLGKWLGLAAAFHLLASWTFIGVCLAVAWFSLLARCTLPIAFAWFVGFSGLDAVGYAVRVYAQGSMLNLPPADAGVYQVGDRLERWASNWEYNAAIAALFQAPNQALIGWIGAGLLCFCFFTLKTRRPVLWIGVLALLWSPLVFCGFAYLLLVDLLYTRWQDRERALLAGSKRLLLLDYLSWTNVAALLLGSVMVIFYASKLAPLVPPLDSMIESSWIFRPQQPGGVWGMMPLLGLFLLLEGLIFIPLLNWQMTEGRQPLARWYLALFGGLTLLACIEVGKYNDLTMRAAIPLLFMLGVWVSRSQQKWPDLSWRRRLLWLGIGAIAILNPATEIARHVRPIWTRGHLIELRYVEQYNLVERYAVDFELIRQYVSAKETLFFQWFAPSLVAPRSAPTPILFADNLVLTHFSANRDRVAPGGQVTLSTEWQAVRDIPVNYNLALRLVDANGQLLAENQGWPVNMSTATWLAARRLYHDQRILTLPPESKPGFYRLDLYVTTVEEGNKLPIYRLPDGAALGEILPISYLWVGESDLSVEKLLPSPVPFGNELALLGTTVKQEQNAGKNGAILVKVVWQTLRRPIHDYVAFAHLVNADGMLIAQDDHAPVSRAVPTSLWQPGLTLPDEFRLEAPTVPPGAYQILLGLYDPHTGARLPVTPSNQGDAYLLADVTIPFQPGQ